MLVRGGVGGWVGGGWGWGWGGGGGWGWGVGGWWGLGVVGGGWLVGGWGVGGWGVGWGGWGWGGVGWGGVGGVGGVGGGGGFRQLFVAKMGRHYSDILPGKPNIVSQYFTLLCANKHKTNEHQMVKWLSPFMLNLYLDCFVDTGKNYWTVSGRVTFKTSFQLNIKVVYIAVGRSYWSLDWPHY